MKMTKAHKRSTTRWFWMFAVALLVMIVAWTITESLLATIGVALFGLGFLITGALLVLDKAHRGTGRQCRLGTTRHSARPKQHKFH